MTETMESRIISDAMLAESTAHMHYALLRVAGRVPDEVLVQARDLLARGEVVAAASALMFAVGQYRVAIDSRDADLLGTLLADEPGIAARRADLEVVDGDVITPYVFDHPEGSGPDPFTGEETTPPQLDPELDGDAAGIRAAVAEWAGQYPHDVVGVWRVVRTPSHRGSWPRPRMVWVVEVADESDAVETAASFMRLLREHGVALPLVESYHIGTRLPAYQDVGRLRGDMVWWSELLVGADEPRVANVFDSIDDEGLPHFDEDHPRIPEEERAILAEYLAAGEPLLMTTGLIDDILAPERTEVVPLSFRTDGTWIWVDAIEYYLVEHGIAPEPELLEHLRARVGTAPSPSGVQLYRALAVMQRGDDEPADEAGADGVEPPAAEPGDGERADRG
jgi:hypothetical protein